MKVYFNNSCKICRSEINLYKKENIKDIDWIDITNNSDAKKETSRNDKDRTQVFAVQESISIPIPFRYGFDFDIIAFIPIALIYVITAIDSSGDITANCMISKQDVKGEGYINRIKNGVLGDGVNSAIAAIFNTLPNTTSSQNNGVIQLTGIASRHVGVWIGGILIVIW